MSHHREGGAFTSNDLSKSLVVGGKMDMVVGISLLLCVADRLIGFGLVEAMFMHRFRTVVENTVGVRGLVPHGGMGDLDCGGN